MKHGPIIFEVCGDNEMMENFGGSDLTACNEKEGKNKYVCYGWMFVFNITHGLKLIIKLIKQFDITKFCFEKQHQNFNIVYASFSVSS